MKQRLVYIDVLKALAIFLVVWGHAIMHFSESDYHLNVVWKWIYSFHMPLFMTIVGFFASSSLSKKTTDFLKHKFIQLILPCICWIAIIYLAMVIVIPNYNASVKTFSHALFQEVWFLKSAFLCYLLFYFTSRIFGIDSKNKSYSIGFILVSLIISQIIPLWKLNQMYPCFLCGLFLFRYKDRIFKHWKSVALLTAVIYISLIICLDDYKFTPISEAKRQLLSGNYNVLSELFITQLRGIAIGISATISLVALFYGFINGIPSDNKSITLFSNIGRYTLAIYLIQTLLLEKIAAQYININDIPESVFNLIITPILSVIIIYVSIRVARFIETNKTLSLFLLGKES